MGDFLQSLAKGEPFHPNFDDAVRTQAVLEAVEASAQSQIWVKLPAR